mgnify:CR=1 FL=1
MDADASAAFCRRILDGLCPIGRFAIGYWQARDVLHDRQAAFELRRLGDGYMVAEGGDLISDTLKGVAEPSPIDDKATSYSGGFWLVADKLNKHNCLFLIISYSLRSRNLINLISRYALQSTP